MTSSILTGRVHIGKTTVCRAVAELATQRGYCVRGILTLPMLDRQGVRLGLRLESLATRKRRVLARTDVDWAGPRVGPYRFDPEALRWGQDVISRAIAIGCDLLIVDEIGRLELEQGTGFSHVLDLLATSIVARSLVVVRESLLDAFRRRLPTLQFVQFVVTQSNRQTLPLEIVERLFLV